MDTAMNRLISKKEGNSEELSDCQLYKKKSAPCQFALMLILNGANVLGGVWEVLCCSNHCSKKIQLQKKKFSSGNVKI